MKRCQTCHFAPCRCEDLRTPALIQVEQCRHNKPCESQALKVRPCQIPEAIEMAKKMGVAVDFKPDGTPTFASRKQKALYCRKHGVANMDGSYGDI